MKKSNIFVVILLVILLIIGGYLGWTKYQEKLASDKALTEKAKEVPSYEKYRPKESIVSFYLTPTKFENPKVGDLVNVSLKMNTNEEELKSFAAVFKYYQARMTFKDYKLTPEFADAKVEVDKERGYITVKSGDLKTPANGDIEIIKFTVELSEEGLGFFDLTNGDLEAINMNGENIADYKNVDKVGLNILPKEGSGVTSESGVVTESAGGNDSQSGSVATSTL